MSEELGNRIQEMFKSIYEATDRKYLRPLKRDMFKCGIECLNDKNSIREAENCIEKCGQPMHKGMSILQTEVTAFQGRIDRCLMNCQDDVRNEKEEERARKIFDGCAEKCVNQFTPVTAEVIKTICEKLDALKKEKK